MSIGFNLKSPATLVLNQSVSLFFEALKPGIDFSSPAMKVLEGCLVHVENPDDSTSVYNMVY